jgi:peptidoglycan/xylan/chitin deacetylase (PgdA/CDA1 family)
MVNHEHIDRILRLIHRSGIGALAGPFAGGAGGILMFHHVRPFAAKGFTPNRGLEIGPAFLDELLHHCQQAGYDFIALGDLPARLKAGGRSRFLCLTFDDGYRDNAVHALPILKRYEAPFTLFVATGYADQTQPLWWLDMADLLEPDHVVSAGGQSFDLRLPGQRDIAFESLINWFTSGPSGQRILELHKLMRAHGVEPKNHARDLCLDWSQIAALLQEPLCTIGAHTLTHPLLATLEPAAAMKELAMSKAVLEQKCGRVVDQIAYPVGSRIAVGAREFAMAREAGFQIGVTTRSGVIFPVHMDHLTALPRVSINGYHQSIAASSALLSGLPFLLANKGRRVILD